MENFRDKISKKEVEEGDEEETEVKEESEENWIFFNLICLGSGKNLSHLFEDYYVHWCWL